MKRGPRPTDAETHRRSMVQTQLVERGIRHPGVIEAMGIVPREVFVDPDLADAAYRDAALPIAEGQTISQPFIVALMLEAVAPGPDDHALEVGTGSGYGAAVLSRLVARVETIERWPDLAATARARLRSLGYDNVFVHDGDGSLGLPDRAPFDEILVTAAGPHVPDVLRRQLRVGGRLVMPVGRDPGSQRLVRVTRESADRFEETAMGEVRFVPLVGEEGWTPAAAGE